MTDQSLEQLNTTTVSTTAPPAVPPQPEIEVATQEEEDAKSARVRARQSAQPTYSTPSVLPPSDHVNVNEEENEEEDDFEMVTAVTADLALEEELVNITLGDGQGAPNTDTQPNFLTNLLDWAQQHMGELLDPTRDGLFVSEAGPQAEDSKISYGGTPPQGAGDELDNEDDEDYAEARAAATPELKERKYEPISPTAAPVRRSDRDKIAYEEKHRGPTDEEIGLDRYSVTPMSLTQAGRSGIGIDGDSALLDSFIIFLRGQEKALKTAPQAKVAGRNAFVIKSLTSGVGNVDREAIAQAKTDLARAATLSDLLSVFAKHQVSLAWTKPLEEVKKATGTTLSGLGALTAVAGITQIVAGFTTLAVRGITLTGIEKDWFYTAVALMQLGLQKRESSNIEIYQTRLNEFEAGYNQEIQNLEERISDLQIELNHLPHEETPRSPQETAALDGQIQNARNDRAKYIENAARQRAQIIDNLGQAQGKLSESDHANFKTINALFDMLGGNRAALFSLGLSMYILDVGLFAHFKQPAESSALFIQNSAVAVSAIFEAFAFRSGPHTLKKLYEAFFATARAIPEMLIGNVFEDKKRTKLYLWGNLKHHTAVATSTTVAQIYFNDLITQVNALFSLLTTTRSANQILPNVLAAYNQVFTSGTSSYVKHCMTATMEMLQAGGLKGNKNLSINAYADKLFKYLGDKNIESMRSSLQTVYQQQQKQLRELEDTKHITQKDTDDGVLIRMKDRPGGEGEMVELTPVEMALGIEDDFIPTSRLVSTRPEIASPSGVQDDKAAGHGNGDGDGNRLAAQALISRSSRGESFLGKTSSTPVVPPIPTVAPDDEQQFRPATNPS